MLEIKKICLLSEMMVSVARKVLQDKREITILLSNSKLFLGNGKEEVLELPLLKCMLLLNLNVLRSTMPKTSGYLRRQRCFS